MNQYMPTGDRDEPPTIGKYDMFFKVRPDTSGTANGSNKGKHILLANNFKAKALQKAYGKPQNVKITKSKSSANATRMNTAGARTDDGKKTRGMFSTLAPCLGIMMKLF